MGQAQEKLDHAIEPAYALVTLILSWRAPQKYRLMPVALMMNG
jgi:hypothetical protein